MSVHTWHIKDMFALPQQSTQAEEAQAGYGFPIWAPFKSFYICTYTQVFLEQINKLYIYLLILTFILQLYA